jgi:hypothetical protein
VSCYRAEAAAIVVAVRLTPRADRDAVEGVGALSDGRQVLRARVRAVPDKGAANAALVALLAKTFRRPKSAVSIVAGASQRIKSVRIEGAVGDLGQIADGLRQL